MQTKADKFRFLAAQVLVGLSGLLMVAATACTSKPAPKVASTNAPSPDHFDGGTYCVQTFLEGLAPSQPLHFSNSVIESDPSLKTKDFQADYAGDNVDLVHKEKWLATDEDRQAFKDTQKFDDPKVLVRTINGDTEEDTITNHATRSDHVSWRGVVVAIAQGGTPWSVFLSKPPVSRSGAENVNGFDTIKYTVDTTHQNQSDKMPLMMIGKLQDYNITGTAWVLKDANCVLQYNIEYQQTTKDGKVSKTHYEGTITKK